MRVSALPLALIVAAAPAGAQTSSCVRDSSGALHCSSSAARSVSVGVANPVRRPPASRNLSAEALARSRSQAQALNDSLAQQRRALDSAASARHRIQCPASPPPLSGAPAPAGTCR